MHTHIARKQSRGPYDDAPMGHRHEFGNAQTQSLVNGNMTSEHQTSRRYLERKIRPLDADGTYKQTHAKPVLWSLKVNQYFLRFLAVVLVGAFMLNINACNTMHGVGKDVHKAGDKITKEADEHKDKDKD